jgi:cobalt-zinc-cadmium efflux system membrane fusion protein
MNRQMKNSLNARKKAAMALSAVGAVVLATVVLKLGHVPAQAASESGEGASVTLSNTASTKPPSNSLELTPGQLSTIVIEPVGSHSFPIEKEAVGNIDFDFDHSVQVFPNYQGKLLKTFVELGDDVHKGDPLYTIDSPDLVQAESTVIAAAATLDLTDKELARAKDLYATNYGVSQRELEQATNDEQAADGALKAARDALRVFGKTEAEISQIIAARKIDAALVVPSPISGQITSKNAPPGYLVQPGTPPAPYSVADLSVKWMFGDVIESDSPAFRIGQPVEVKVMAYPGRVFKGKVNKVYETVDPNVHTLQIRSEISDPKNELRPGMLANFVIRVQDPIEAVAIPANGVVREGDGSMTAWVTTDRHRFTQRPIKTGMRHNQMVQVVDGLEKGELVVADGAVFLSNMLAAPPSD